MSRRPYLRVRESVLVLPSPVVVCLIDDIRTELLDVALDVGPHGQEVALNRFMSSAAACTADRELKFPTDPVSTKGAGWATTGGGGMAPTVGAEASATAVRGSTVVTAGVVTEANRAAIVAGGIIAGAPTTVPLEGVDEDDKAREVVDLHGKTLDLGMEFRVRPVI